MIDGPPNTPFDGAPGASPAREVTGAQILCEALIREGVAVLFGIPGGCIMPFYHALWEYRSQLRHVLVRHEQGGGHAAEGYARATGRVGVCIGTSGPGATNLVTPIADAWMDGTPLVAITGQVPSHLLGTDAFQETDITGITVPITKHNYLVTRAADIPRVVREAFHIAQTGRPGPVLIDITKDAQQERCVPDWDVRMDLPGYRPASRRADFAAVQAIEAAVGALLNARRPLVLAGNGVMQANASHALRRFAERTGMPVVTTLHGLGAMPHDHPLMLGMPGMHGWVHVNRAIQQCDVLFNIGSRFDDRVTGKVSAFAPHARVIHVDIDAAEIGKLVTAHIGILGDARDVLETITPRIPVQPERFAPWREEIAALKAEFAPRQHYRRSERTAPLMPQDVFAAFNAVADTRRDWRVVTDVGQHQMWAAQLIDWQRARSHITSGGAGTMGFAVPAALGAAIADPAHTVWAFCGDGGFQMTACELATIRQEGLGNVKVAVVNNGYLGMVRQWQQLFEGRRYSETPLSGPDFALLAQAHGWHAITVDDVADAEAAIREAWAHHGPVLIDFRVEREANVFPMVPAGRAIHDMVHDEAHHDQQLRERQRRESPMGDSRVTPRTAWRTPHTTEQA
ncbi:biosynthetic-type acetolactate synthase large subunit [Gemmatimonas sp.]|jgi:acetolactate synthase-1/2/3 large subunit|uniref:biosynthetic-type acetolactate synthase large subunit n=1 Tax=Gemmatimonas sp. TaxID=1962908 RepID=UPI0022C6610D|nr:biosynthetic-type acetolactate synthase large subunit [Gemmatimonas sp.]MCZ8204652.1 biosynthetic-type acetolactate synthase large subunit [Gemmatimonas sp.]